MQIICVLLLSAVLFSCSTSSKEGLFVTIAGGAEFTVHPVCINFERTADFTSHTSKLGDKTALLYAYPHDRYIYLFATSVQSKKHVIAFIDANRKIRQVERVATGIIATETKGITSEAEVRYALILDDNTTEDKKISAGQVVEFSDDLLSLKIEDFPSVKVGKYSFYVEIADDDLERMKGLMHRSKLSKNEGMLFVFDDEDYRSFWMGKTLLPLTILFIKKDGIVDVVHKMDVYKDPFDQHVPTYPSRQRCKYALEINQDVITENLQNGNVQISEK
ncbi:MAG: DUF192 domain-containing protein [Planctomycetes bacterium]|nr:DUF192 domain-containing protein [Planctomycetota bacterium]